MSEALPSGTRIIGGRYLLLRLLYERPRVNLYLGWRLPRAGQNGGMVAIRELVLSGLPAEGRARVVQAAWEELLAPGVVNAQHLPAAAIESVWMGSERGRHYLVLRLFEDRGGCSVVMPLADLLQQRYWPRWLDWQVAVAWTILLSRIVARLHHQGTILVDFDPSTILIDETGMAAWAPLLLPSWPPSPCFWPGEDRVEDYFPHLFPQEDAFAAPELSSGWYDERADVYTLGAMLYLLLTRHAPVSAPRRLLYTHHHQDGLELVSPRFFCRTLPSALEKIVSRALALEPGERYPSVFTLVEALEEAQANLMFVKQRFSP
ncbi:MAG TPA: hypothetical protein VKV40_21350 [Ktedonobacteraceae bacterium]|nr:hypothetical protein [Ktedonobacteraceae bacterium]